MNQLCDLGTTTMTADEVTTIETQLDVQLPGAYRECIALCESLPPTDWDVFITDATALLEANEEVRCEDVFGLEWPTRYFIIGWKSGKGGQKCSVEKPLIEGRRRPMLMAITHNVLILYALITLAIRA